MTPKTQLKNTGNERGLEIDILTLIAIAILAWGVVNVSHEIVGHAGAAVLLGIPVRAVSTTTAAIAGDQLTSIGAYRTIMAAGTVMNLVGGAAALLLLRVQRQAKSATRYFLWLFATFSFIIATMNLVSVMFIGAGDWTEFTRELEPRVLWKAIIIGVGVILTVGILLSRGVRGRIPVGAAGFCRYLRTGASGHYHLCYWQHPTQGRS